MELGRFYYVTPTSYLELINMFQILMREKKDKDWEEIMRYETGVQKLKDTEVSVSKMREELDRLIPEVVENKKQT